MKKTKIIPIIIVVIILFMAGVFVAFKFLDKNETTNNEKPENITGQMEELPEDYVCFDCQYIDLFDKLVDDVLKQLEIDKTSNFEKNITLLDLRDVYSANIEVFNTSQIECNIKNSVAHVKVINGAIKKEIDLRCIEVKK